MTGLDTSTFADYADHRYGEAQETIDTHTISAYTGLCLACGRPGPCDELRTARDLAAHYARPGMPVPGTTPPPAALAVTTAAGTTDDLRDTALAIHAATDRATAHLDGVHHLHRRLAAWQRALTDAWQTLGLVHAGLADARRLPDTPAGSAAEILTGLRAARADADRAATLAAAARLRLTVAEDRLRRTGQPAAQIAARRWAGAIARLDLVTARLAIGALALDRYAAVIAGVGPAPTAAPPRLPTLSAAGAGYTAPAMARCRTDVAAGAATASQLIAQTRHRDRPSFWAKVRHQLGRETRQ